MTLQNYCRAGRSTLVRGVDFGVRRPNAFRRQLFFTEHGIARLIARDYQASYRGKGQLRNELAHAKQRDPMTYCASERRAMLRHNIAIAFDRYLRMGGCAVPNCPCVIHQHPLNVPQADYIHVMMEPRPSTYPKGGSYSPETGKFYPKR